MIDFLSLYENKGREIESLCLLKLELEHRGYSVVIEQIQYFFKRKYRTKVVVTPFLYNDNDLYKYVFCIAGKSQKIINLRWEQVFSRENEANLDSFFYPKDEALKAVHVCWGINQANNLKKLNIEDKCLPVAGAMHLDLIRKKGYFKERSEIASNFNLCEEKKWILFISSFSHTTFSNKEKREIIEFLGKERIEFIEISVQSKEKVLDWLVRIGEKGYEVIYRPHPSEKKDQLLEKLERKFSYFHVISDESVGQWIYCSDRVLNWCSTSAIQSILLGKGDVILRPVEIDYRKDVGIFDKAHKVKTYSELEMTLQEEVKKPKDESFSGYYRLDGSAYQEVAAVCEQCLKSELDQDIDYERILRCQPAWKRIKYEILYKLYVPLLGTLYRKGILRRITASYGMVIRNTASEGEMDFMGKRIKGLLYEE